MSGPTSRRGFRDLHGIEVPVLLYGTAWKEERTRSLVELALDAGFVGIDTANQRKHYVEAAVGEAVGSRSNSGDLRRSELFLQTKFTFRDGQDHRLPYDPSAALDVQVSQSFESSLSHLGTDFVDSYVLHGPSTGRGLARADHEVWRAMESLVAAGRAKHLGVSNVTLEQLRALTDFAAVKPAFVQNRCYAARGWDRAVRTFCLERGIVYQGFSLLTANHRELESPMVKRMAERVGCSVPGLVFRFAVQLGMVPLTGTSSSEHMRADLASADLELESGDVRALERLAG